MRIYVCVYKEKRINQNRSTQASWDVQSTFIYIYVHMYKEKRELKKKKKLNYAKLRETCLLLSKRTCRLEFEKSRFRSL